jgi:hypothetical protein
MIGLWVSSELEEYVCGLAWRRPNIPEFSQNNSEKPHNISIIVAEFWIWDFSDKKEES